MEGIGRASQYIARVSQRMFVYSRTSGDTILDISILILPTLLLYTYIVTKIHSYIHHTKYIFCFERRNPIWKIASKIGLKNKMSYKKNDMKWAVFACQIIH